jgi:enoyl-CoA hydratase
VALGVLPGTGGTQRLGRLLGKSKAIELMATGRLLSFEEAQELGLVNRVFESDGFWEQVMEYARHFVPPAKASKAVGCIKRAVCSGLDVPFSEGLALERELQQQLFISEDAREGLLAYLEKRKPAFKGA